MQEDPREKLKKEIKDLTANQQGAQRDLEAKQAQVKEAEVEVTKTRERRDTILAEIKSARTELTDIQTQIATKQGSLQEASIKEAELVKTIKRLTDSIEQTEKDEQTTIESYTRQRNQYQTKIATAKTELAEVTRLLSEAKVDHDEEIKRAHNKMQELNERHESVLKAIDIHLEEEKAAKVKADNETARLKSLEHSTEKQAAKLTELRGELEQIKEDIQVEGRKKEEAIADRIEEEEKAGQLKMQRLSFARMREELQQRESHIRMRFKDAGVPYPEFEPDNNEN